MNKCNTCDGSGIGEYVTNHQQGCHWHTEEPVVEYGYCEDCKGTGFISKYKWPEKYNILEVKPSKELFEKLYLCEIKDEYKQNH